VLLWCIAIPGDCSQALTIDRRNGEGYSCAHPLDSHAHSRKGIPIRTPMSGGNH
jgi:hypothetical protein